MFSGRQVVLLLGWKSISQEPVCSLVQSNSVAYR